MTIFSYTLKRFLRNKLSLVVILVVPALIVGLLFGFASNPHSEMSVGIVDQDSTPLTAMLHDYLSESFPVNSLEEADIRRALAGNEINYAMVIEPGFTEKLLHNDMPKIRGYGIQETNLYRPVKHKVESFFSAAGNIATIAGDRDTFYKGMDDYKAGAFRVNVQSYSDVDKSLDGAFHSMGFLAMTMMFFSVIGAINLVEERKNYTYFRVLASPISLKSYTFQKILSFFVLLLVMVAFAMFAVQFMFGIYLGVSPLNLFVVMAFFSLLCVSMSVALASLTRTTQQVGTIATLTIMPLTMLGGLFWPREIMPQILQTIGEFLPTTWVMEAAGTVILGNSLASAATELTVLAGFTLVFFLLGSWRQKDIAV